MVGGAFGVSGVKVVVVVGGVCVVNWLLGCLVIFIVIWWVG